MTTNTTPPTLPASNGGRNWNWLLWVIGVLALVAILASCAIGANRLFNRGEAAPADPTPTPLTETAAGNSATVEEGQTSWDDMSLENWQNFCRQLVFQTNPAVGLVLKEGNIACSQVLVMKKGAVPIFDARPTITDDADAPPTPVSRPVPDDGADREGDKSGISGPNDGQADVIETFNAGEWQVEKVFGLTELMTETWIPGLELNPVSPELWPTFPNVPNPLVTSFRVVNGTEVPDGLEYGMAESMYCQQDQRCDFQVAARHYRLFSGDYDFSAVGESCHADEEVGVSGCAISVWNIGDVTAIYEDETFDQGFTVTGRYWNGDVLHIAMNGLMSHTAANMLNMDTMGSPLETLNRSDRTNAGANCSNPEGCGAVDLRIVVISGNEVLFTARTLVESPSR